MTLTIANEKNEQKCLDSHQIGLKSIQRVIELHQGDIFIQDLEQSFTIVLSLPYE